MIGESRFDQGDDHRHLLCVVIATLAVETDKSTASADRLVHVDVRVDKVSQMSDHDTTWIDAGVFEDVQLFDRSLAGNSRVRKDWDVRCDVRFADGTEHLALIRGHLVPRADFSEGPESVVIRLFDERPDDLLSDHLM